MTAGWKCAILLPLVLVLTSCAATVSVTDSTSVACETAKRHAKAAHYCTQDPHCVRTAETYEAGLRWTAVAERECPKP